MKMVISWYLKIEKKILLFTLISTFFGFSQLCLADINSDMQNYFNDVGYTSNITSPHAAEGQEAGFYSGGSLFLRAPTRDLQIVHIDTPSIKSGCGGIDLFAGGASFVDSQQLVTFGKNVLQQSPEVALQIALETYTPQLSKVMSMVQEWAQKANNMNISSCEAATDLVAGIWPKNTAATRYICQDVGTQDGKFSDWLSARLGCSDPDQAQDALNKGNTDPKYKNQIPVNKNIVWTALQNNGFLQSDPTLAEFFMTISGTVVFDKNGQPTVYPAHAQDSSLLNVMLQGGDATIYRCDETTNCLNITEQKITISPNSALQQKTLAILLALQSQFSTDTALTQQERGFLEYTSYPVLKFISLEYESGRQPDMAMFADAIAEDLLSQYLISISNTIKDTLSMTTSYNEQITKPIYENINSGITYLDSIQSAAREKIASMTQVIENYMQIEKRVVGNFSAQTQENYSFGE